jgi:preprotein translocase subunit SecG
MISLSSLMSLSYQFYKVASIICIAVAALCALFIVIVILMQSGNSEGVSALGGQSDTFYGKNKSKTLEHKLKILTGICIGIIAVLMVVYFILQLIP